jgi:hypothetical protein
MAAMLLLAMGTAGRAAELPDWLILLAVPATGLLMHFNVTFLPRGGVMPMAPAQMTLAQAVESAGRRHDLGNMVWIRRMGARHMLRSGADRRFQGYIVTPAGLSPVQRNWPRALHEGLYGGYAGSAVNAMLSVAMIALSVTGLTLWARRRQARVRRQA